MPKPIALSKSRTLVYVLDSQKDDPEEEKIRWHLRALPWAVRRELGTTVSSTVDGEASIDSNLLERYGTALRYGLAKISGAALADDTGSIVELEFERAMRHGVHPLTEACLARIPDDVIVSVGYAVWELSSTGAATLGKFGSQPTSPPDASAPSAPHVGETAMPSA